MAKLDGTHFIYGWGTGACLFDSHTDIVKYIYTKGDLIHHIFPILRCISRIIPYVDLSLEE